MYFKKKSLEGRSSLIAVTPTENKQTVSPRCTQKHTLWHGRCTHTLETGGVTGSSGGQQMMVIFLFYRVQSQKHTLWHKKTLVLSYMGGWQTVNCRPALGRRRLLCIRTPCKFQQNGLTVAQVMPPTWARPANWSACGNRTQRPVICFRTALKSSCFIAFRLEANIGRSSHFCHEQAGLYWTSLNWAKAIFPEPKKKKKSNE